MNKATIKKILDDNYYWFNVNKYDDSTDIEFGKHTPEGEDWFECLDWTSAKKFIEDLERRVDNFDVDEEVEIWIPLRGNNGVPEKITDLLADAEWKKHELEDLLATIQAKEI